MLSEISYYNEIKNKIIDNEVYSRVKDYSKRIFATKYIGI